MEDPLRGQSWAQGTILAPFHPVALYLPHLAAEGDLPAGPHQAGRKEEELMGTEQQQKNKETLSFRDQSLNNKSV